MTKRFMALFIAASMLFAQTAFGYKRDAPPKNGSGNITAEEPNDEPAKEGSSDDEYQHERKGEGMITAGYVLLAAGSAAAIAGGTLITATNKDLTGAIISAGGAVMGLAGSMLIIFGSRSGGYAVAPSVDPARGTYGLAMAGNF